MKASPARCTALPHRGARPFTFQWCLLGIFLAFVVFLLFTSSDACVLPPPFEALELADKPKPYYEVGEQVTYRCKAGYDYVFGVLVVTTCEQNHSWVPISDDACRKKKCSRFSNPENGRVEYPDGSTSWDMKAHFHCSYGYYLIGKAVVTCVLKNGTPKWNAHSPECSKILCKPPPKIKDGKYTFSDVEVFEYMETVTYSCDKKPGAEELSVVGQRQLYCVGNQKWSSPAPECKVVKCPYPEVPNGKQLAGFGKKFSYNATVMFDCIEGFHLKGSDISVCTGNSTWDPPLPKCIKVPPPPSTIPPTLSYSASASPSTKPPVSTVSGPRPTHPPKPPVYNYPGYPHPTEGLFDETFAKWIIVLLIIISIVAVLIIVTWICRHFRNKNKGKADIRAQYSTYRERTSTPAEQTV